MRFTRKVLGFLLHVLIAYVVAWHAAFAVVFAYDGGQIDFRTYVMYLKFIFGPGFEIPTYIQFLAIAMCLIYFVVRWGFRMERSLRSRS